MYQQIPERTDLVDGNSGSDFNQLEKNIEAIKGGDPANPPTISLEDFSALRGSPDGIATLGPDGKVLTAQIPLSLLGVVSYKDTWDAANNNPPIPVAVSSNKGWYYVVSVEGSYPIDGITDWKVGDWLISNGSLWQKVDNTEKLDPESLEYLVNKGAPGGYASLDLDGKLVASQLPGVAGDMKKAVYDPDEDGIVEKAKDSFVLAINNNPYLVPKGTVVNMAVVGSELHFLEANSSNVSKMPAHGLLAEDVGPGALGKILRFGTLFGLDTSSFASGAFLYAGDTGPFYLTDVRPDSPNIAQWVGRVVVSDVANGIIFVSPQPPQGIFSTTICAGNDPRLSDERNPLPHSHAAVDISDSSATGRAILTGTPAEGRSALGVDPGGSPRPPDIDGLGEGTTPSFLDFLPTRDESATSEKKVLVERLLPFTGYRKWWCLGDDLTTTTAFGLASNVSGTGAANSSVATPAGRIGIVSAATGTTATGRAGFITGVSAIRLGQGLCRCAIGARIPTASDGTNTFSVRFGFIDSGSAESTDGVFFRYSHSVNGGNWQCVTRNNSSETAINTSLTPTTWRDFRIEIAEDGSSAEFFSGGTSLGTISTNIPIASGRETGFGAVITKSLGTASRTLELDYPMAWGEFLTERIL